MITSTILVHSFNLTAQFLLLYMLFKEFECVILSPGYLCSVFYTLYLVGLQAKNHFLNSIPLNFLECFSVMLLLGFLAHGVIIFIPYLVSFDATSLHFSSCSSSFECSLSHGMMSSTPISTSNNLNLVIYPMRSKYFEGYLFRMACFLDRFFLYS